MRYVKEPLTLEEQADRLLGRGLLADRDELIRRLAAVSYFRLSGYLFPFRQHGCERYAEGTRLEMIWRRYCFDRRLRVLFLDAIERVEVAVRARLVHHFSHAHGPFGYVEEERLPKLKILEYIEWREGLIVETSRSKEVFKQHFFKKYGDAHRNLPLWMVSELMSMGRLLTFYKGVDDGIARDVAGDFEMPDELLLSWLRSLYAVRNTCAHHARLWNRILGYPPSLPQKNKHPDWHLKDKEGRSLLLNDRVGIVLMICRRFLRRISPTSQWCARVDSVFEEYPEIPVQQMGLPEDWRNHPLWKL